jgi:hypothetical protein
MEPRQLLGRLLGDLLDLDSALGGEHEERLLLAPVERDREVVLPGDLRRRLDPELAHDVAVDVESEDLRGFLLGVVGPVRELDATRFPTPAGQHLRLDDDLAAELLGSGAGLGRRQGELPFRRWDAEPPEELLALEFVEIHRRRTLAAAGWLERRSTNDRAATRRFRGARAARPP